MLAFRSLKCSRSALGAVALAALAAYVGACAVGCGGDSSSIGNPLVDGSLGGHDSAGQEPSSDAGEADSTVGGDTRAGGGRSGGQRRGTRQNRRRPGNDTGADASGSTPGDAGDAGSGKDGGGGSEGGTVDSGAPDSSTPVDAGIGRCRGRRDDPVRDGHLHREQPGLLLRRRGRDALVHGDRRVHGHPDRLPGHSQLPRRRHLLPGPHAAGGSRATCTASASCAGVRLWVPIATARRAIRALAGSACRPSPTEASPCSTGASPDSTEGFADSTGASRSPDTEGRARSARAPRPPAPMLERVARARQRASPTHPRAKPMPLLAVETGQSNRWPRLVSTTVAEEAQ